MFKQSSKTHFTLLTIVAACVLFAAGSVTAQFKGYKSVLKTPIDISKDVVLANPAFNIDQCANLNPSCDWINGELGHQNSDYSEDDSVAFRVKLTNLTAGQTYSYTINWDATDNPTPNHGYDYLTTYNRTVAGADVCAGVTNCPATSSTFPIPTDFLVKAGPDGILGNGDDITQIPGDFTLFGGTITGTSGYTYTDGFNGGSKVSITINFTANAETVVLAWGGHISTRADWLSRGAGAFTGSPYHMRNGSFCTIAPPAAPDCKGGNADLQLKVDQVDLLTGMRIIKEVNVVGGVSGQAFSFIPSADFNGGVSFNLTDNNTIADRKTQFYPGAVGPVTVLESPIPANWSLTAVNCTLLGSGGSAAGSAGLHTATITLAAGNFAVCTFVNTFSGPTAATASISGRVATANGMGIRGALVTVFDAGTGESKTAVTNTFGNYTFKDLQVDSFYVMNVSAKRYTFTNNQQEFLIQGDLANINFTSDQ